MLIQESVGQAPSIILSIKGERHMGKKVMVLANFYARQGEEKRLEPILYQLMEESRKENGCLTFEFFQNMENSGRYSFVEEWDNEENFSAHLAAPHLAEAKKLMSGLLMQEQEVYTCISADQDAAAL